MAKHLYVIGNGFDRYHGAASRYLDFHNYLFARNPEIIGAFDLYFGPKTMEYSFKNDLGWYWCVQSKEERRKYGLPYPKTTWAKEHLWANFEEYLGDMNREKVYEDLDQHYPKKLRHAQKFTLGEYMYPLESLTMRMTYCTMEMKYHFHRWVNKLHFAKGWKEKQLVLEKDAIYLTFNYTTFLESAYEIPAKQICYIHGSRKDKFGQLVLGHRCDINQEFEKWKHQHMNRRRYRPNLKDEKGRYYANDNMPYLRYFLKDKERGNWHNVYRYNVVLEAEKRLEDYYQLNFKDTASIIKKHQSFFDSLEEIEMITVLGHSLSKVDMPYFERIKKGLRDCVKWQFSVWGKRDEQVVRRFCKKMHIDKSNYKMISIASLIRPKIVV